MIFSSSHDPTYTGTDHTREKVPFLAYSKAFEGSGLLPAVNSFGTIGATILENFGLEAEEHMIGESVLGKLK